MEDQLRVAIFKWIAEQCNMHGDVLSRDLLLNGFEFDGQKIPLMGASGIWKPRQLNIPISITSTASGKYDDDFTENNLILYKYREEGGPNHPDNIGLGEAYKNQIPLVYFRRLIPGKYYVAFPVFIIQDDPIKQQVLIAIEDANKVDIFQPAKNPPSDSDNYRRIYLTSTILQRLHQRGFRERVLIAYNTRCCLCRLNHYELLDAAHIIADKEEKGDPIVPNGLPLCKIHHAAFDINIIGISPDYEVIVRKDVLEEIDGPMLKHGIQEMDGNKLLLPTRKLDYPDKQRLKFRFEKFKKAC